MKKPSIVDKLSFKSNQQKDKETTKTKDLKKQETPVIQKIDEEPKDWDLYYVEPINNKASEKQVVPAKSTIASVGNSSKKTEPSALVIEDDPKKSSVDKNFQKGKPNTVVVEDNSKKPFVASVDSNLKKSKPIFYYKPTVEKKLTIILIENSLDVAKENDKLVKIIKNLVPTGLATIIHYGSEIKQTEISEIHKFKDTDFQCDENAGNMVCLFDALVKLKKIVSDEYLKKVETELNRIFINKIDIIGIGTCRDNCSNASKETGIESFSKVAQKTDVLSKYFCLTEDSFLEAAEIGFRSIGSIAINYQ